MAHSSTRKTENLAQNHATSCSFAPMRPSATMQLSVWCGIDLVAASRPCGEPLSFTNQADLSRPQKVVQFVHSKVSAGRQERGGKRSEHSLSCAVGLYWTGKWVATKRCSISLVVEVKPHTWPGCRPSASAPASPVVCSPAWCNSRMALLHCHWVLLTCQYRRQAHTSTNGGNE